MFLCSCDIAGAVDICGFNWTESPGGYSTWLVIGAGSWVGPQLELWAMGLNYPPCGFSVWLGPTSKHSKRKEVEAGSLLKAWAWKFHNIPSSAC